MKKKKEYPKPTATVYDFSSKYGIMQEWDPTQSAPGGPHANQNSSLFDDDEASNSNSTTWDEED